MLDIHKAFDKSNHDKIVVLASVGLPGYKEEEKIVINRLWNNKIAIFRHDAYRNADSGYILIDFDEFFDTVEVKELYIHQVDKVIRESLIDTLTPLLIKQ